MNPSIQRLYTIAGKKERLIVGLMSGTSVDGLDVALCRISGSGSDTVIKLVNFETIAFSTDFKTEVRSVFSKKNVDLEKLTLLNRWIALQHADIVNDLLKKWNIKKETIDLIASHGQTIYHAPESLHGQKKFGNATLQIGDGDQLAVSTGIITISDFRQKHIAAGGEGAPLASYADYLLFAMETENRLLLNIGGIANFTFLPSKGEGKILCTDAGPGNTLMDAYVQQQFPGKYFDENATIAKQGEVNDLLLEELKQNTFFEQPFPKTTGPELFNLHYLQQAQEKTGTTSLSIYDTMATLTRFSAEMIATAIKTNSSADNIKIFCSGGGIHNPLLMTHLKGLIPYEFFSTDELNIHPDAKEAVLFAVLANECVCGTGLAVNGLINISMGKLSFPD